MSQDACPCKGANACWPTEDKAGACQRYARCTCVSTVGGHALKDALLGAMASSMLVALGPWLRRRSGLRSQQTCHDLDVRWIRA